jgi:hypothetical protein
MEPALYLGEARGSGSRDQPIIQANRNNRTPPIGLRWAYAAASVKFFGCPWQCRRASRPVKPTHAHHQRSDHLSSFAFGLESRSGEPELTPCPRLCDLMSPMGLAYLILGIGTVERFNPCSDRLMARGVREMQDLRAS